MIELKSFLSAVNQFVRRENLFSFNDKIVVAVSGGPDSICLMGYLETQRKRFKLELHCCHINHCLRKPGADNDEAFVRKYCKKRGIPFYSEKVEVRRWSKKYGLSIEEAARNLRYASIVRYAKSKKADAIATAHSLDDQAETVLMRLIRGSGLRGLRSIPPKREEKGIEIIRPFLRTSKKDILCFIKNRGLKFRRDPSNKDSCFLRNRIRERLLPEIEKKYNPKFRAGLVEISDMAQESYEFLSSESRRHFARMVKRRGFERKISVRRLKPLVKVLRSEIFFMVVEDLTGSRKSFCRSHIDSIDRLLGTRSGAAYNLPKHIIAKRVRDNIIFSKTSVND